MTPEKFRSIEKLYHYTSLDTGNKIIWFQRLRMSRQSKMNDINESDRRLFSFECVIDDVENEMNNFFQSSFTFDNGRTSGFSIPAMWAHYAQKGGGMCLVFNKQKLLSKINGEFIRHGCIDYAKQYDSSIIVENNPQEYITKNYEEIFFTKSDDWSYEREYRIICRSEKALVEFDITDCIMAVIVHKFDDIDRHDNVFNSVKCRELINLTKKFGIPVLALERDLEQYWTLTDENSGCWYSETPHSAKYELDLS